MREAMDRLRRDADPRLRDLDAYYGRAFDMLTGKAVAAAFDIADEPDVLRDRYGRHTFGQSALLAPPAGRGGHAVRHGQLRPLGPPWHAAPAQDRGRGPEAHPAAGPGDRGPDRRPDPARAVRLDPRGGDGRVRPHPADEQGRRPRPLGQHVQRPDGLRVDADGPGDRPQQRPRRARRGPARSARRTWPRRSTTTWASTPDRSRSRTGPGGRPTSSTRASRSGSSSVSPASPGRPGSPCANASSARFRRSCRPRCSDRPARFR